VRHYLYAALAKQAQDLGRTTLFDGCYGELSLTGWLVWPGEEGGIRQRLRTLRDLILRPPRGNTQGNGFHVALSNGRMATLPDKIADALAAPTVDATHDTLGDQWGYVTGMEKSLMSPASMAGHQVRWEFPFRDTRLIDLCASFPRAFLGEGGQDRAIARHMLKDRLPDSIRLRPKGTAFSPDYHQRLRRDANGALDRLSAWRAAGANEWLDLDWLEKSLKNPQSADPFTLQLTACVAEFLLWWRSCRL
jgi:asparagine synthase (glutamine-hydrolysing)